MPQLKVAVQLSSLRLPFREALAAAANMGAVGIEIDARGELKPAEVSQTGLRQIRKAIADHGLRVVAVEFITRRGYHVLDELDRRVEATKQAMTFAHALGANLVTNQLGHVPADVESPEWRLMTEVLADLGAWSSLRSMLAAETGTESGVDLRRLLDTLPTGTLGVTLDPGNLAMNGFSPLEAIKELGPRILHVHAHDGARDRAHARGVETTLGRGEVDWPELLAALEEQSYRGYFAVERRGAREPVAEVTQTVEYLQRL